MKIKKSSSEELIDHVDEFFVFYYVGLVVYKKVSFLGHVVDLFFYLSYNQKDIKA